MEVIIVAFIAGVAFWLGTEFGIRQGRALGRYEEHQRQRDQQIKQIEDDAK